MTTDGPKFDDPRMRGFRSRTSVDAVHSWIGGETQRLGPETIALGQAFGRVLAESIVAESPVPGFDRAAMDGYAVRGEETFGADAYGPVVFEVVGRSRPGRPSERIVGPGQAISIATGAMVPRGADTVVKAEVCHLIGSTTLHVIAATPPGRHVGLRGEDIAEGTEVVPVGRRLRPQDLGVLSALGRSQIQVVRSPRVVILVTGDELVPAGSIPGFGLIGDANSPMLASLVARDGGKPEVVGPLPDDRASLGRSIVEAARRADLVLISGGSSTGPEDHAASLVAELGELAIHGVAIRPSSPTGLGRIEGVLVVLLPGNPVSCLCAYDFFGGRIVRILGGRPSAWPYRSTPVRLAQKLSSVLGRVDYARVMIRANEVTPLAVSGASILSSTTRADGFVVIPSDLEGYPVGAEVEVWLYDDSGPG